MTNGEPTSQPAHSYPTVLRTESLNVGNEEVVDANVNVVNAMFAELLDAEEISPNALRSYYVDFYVTQSLGGGFAQYVFTAQEREDIDPYVRGGLEGMGATAHLDLFNRTVAAFGALSDTDVDTYLDGGTGWDAAGDAEDGTSDAVRRLEELDGEFESLLETEDIIALNAAWLRSQQGLLVLSDDELDAHIAGRVARIPNLAERQAAAAEEALLDAPEFEQIIRELCDIAGHTLLRISMGDPNYRHNGESTLAWHFTTEQGEFLMLEDDDEAFMLNPQTKEILAAVEFEEVDA
ncbi:DMP19 family protein [Pseudarthrobacter sp. S9]|uniref:DMP19 family protein n=1 Tax=Pseudarthrobacter sp. S9 TaxID=3418421 RepID=UPI003CFF90AA